MWIQYVASREPLTKVPSEAVSFVVLLKEVVETWKICFFSPMMSERQPTAALDAEDGWCWMAGVCECVCQIKIAAVSLNQLEVAKKNPKCKKESPKHIEEY